MPLTPKPCAAQSRDVCPAEALEYAPTSRRLLCSLCHSAEGYPYRKLGINWVYRCPACAFLYAPATCEPTRLYAELYDNSPTYQQLLAPRVHGKRKRGMAYCEAWFFRRFPKPFGTGRLLEVGCGSGNFLELAAKKGWQVVGVEIAPRAARIAQERGFDVFVGSLQEYVASGPKPLATVTTAFEVLEHVPDPAMFLRDIASATAPGGLVIASTPNARDPFMWRDPRPETHPPVHLCFFTAKTLQRALLNAGLQPREIRTNFLPRGSMRQVVRQRWLRNLLRLPVVVLRLAGLLDGNQLVAIARRPLKPAA